VGDAARSSSLASKRVAHNGNTYVDLRQMGIGECCMSLESKAGERMVCSGQENSL
jgi:hypothetical protein